MVAKRIFGFMSIVVMAACIVLSGVGNGNAAITVYTDNGAMNTPGIYVLPWESYKSASTSNVNPNNAVVVTFDSGSPGAQMIDLGLSNAEVLAATAGSVYVLGVMGAQNSAKQGSVEFLVATTTVAGSPALQGTIVSGKIRFNSTAGLYKSNFDGSSYLPIGSSDLLVVLQPPSASAFAGKILGTGVTKITSAGINAGFNFRPNASLTKGTNLSISTYIDGATTPRSTGEFAKLDNYFEVAINGTVGNSNYEGAKAIVDVNSGRKKFTGGGNSDTVKATLQHRSGITAIQTPTFDGALGNGLQVDVLVPNQALASAKVAGTTLTYGASVSGGYTKTWAPSDLSDGKQTEFTFTVDETNVILTRGFTFNATSLPLSGYPTISYASGTSAGEWTINAYQAVVPYFNTNPQFGSQLVVNNSSSSATEVFFDVLSSSSTVVNANLTPYTNKQVSEKSTLAARTTLLFNSDEILAGLGLPLTDSFGNYYRNSLMITVTTGAGNVTAQAIQADGTTGKRTQPLLKKFSSDMKQD